MSNFSEKAIDYIQCVEAALDVAEKQLNEKELQTNASGSFSPRQSMP